MKYHIFHIKNFPRFYFLYINIFDGKEKYLFKYKNIFVRQYFLNICFPRKCFKKYPR